VLRPTLYISMSRTPEHEDRISRATRVAYVLTKWIELSSSVRTCSLCKRFVILL